MYVCVYVHHAYIGMLIFCTQYASTVLSSVRVAALLLLASPVRLHEFGLQWI